MARLRPARAECVIAQNFGKRRTLYFTLYSPSPTQSIQLEVEFQQSTSFNKFNILVVPLVTAIAWRSTLRPPHPSKAPHGRHHKRTTHKLIPSKLAFRYTRHARPTYLANHSCPYLSNSPWATTSLSTEHPRFAQAVVNNFNQH